LEVSEGDGPVDVLANALKNGATLYSSARSEWRDQEQRVMALFIIISTDCSDRPVLAMDYF
jgi:hypothetical protein